MYISFEITHCLHTREYPSLTMDVIIMNISITELFITLSEVKKLQETIFDLHVKEPK